MNQKFYYNPARHKIGAIIRATDSVDRFEIIQNAIENLLKIKAISLISIMIYKPQEENALRGLLIQKYGKEQKKISIVNVDSGDFYSDLLNFSFQEQTRRGIDYSLSVSPEAYEYITPENFEKIINSIKEGALVVGLKIKEYSGIINQGYFSNAFALYRNTIVNFANIWDIRGFLKEKHLSEKNFGMEELYAIKRILEIYGSGSVVVISPENGQMNYASDEKSQEWKERVLKTKSKRLHEMQSMLEIDSDEFKRLILWK